MLQFVLGAFLLFAQAAAQQAPATPEGTDAPKVEQKPAPEQRTAIEECVTRTLKAFPALVAGEMEKATLLIHTSKPPRPKPPRPEGI